MNTLTKVKNTTDITKVRARVEILPEYQIYSTLTDSIERETLEELAGKQECTLCDLLTIHIFVFGPVANMADMTEIDRHNALFNSVCFGLTKLHVISPRLVKFYIDGMCDVGLVEDLPIGNMMRLKLNFSQIMLFPSILIAPIFGILCHAFAFDNMPKPDSSEAEHINAFREALVKTLTYLS